MVPGDEREVFTVRILPAGIDLAVPAGQPIMRAAQDRGMRWPNACNGQAQCGLCAVEVVAGSLCNSVPGIREAQMLARLAHRPRHGGIMRLACQLAPADSLTVHKLGVRVPAAGDRSAGGNIDGR